MLYGSAYGVRLGLRVLCMLHQSWPGGGAHGGHTRLRSLPLSGLSLAFPLPEAERVFCTFIFHVRLCDYSHNDPNIKVARFQFYASRWAFGCARPAAASSGSRARRVFRRSQPSNRAPASGILHGCRLRPILPDHPAKSARLVQQLVQRCVLSARMVASPRSFAQPSPKTTSRPSATGVYASLGL